MNLLYDIGIYVQIVLLLYLGGSAFYLFVFALFSVFPLKTNPPVDFKKRRFAVLIPGYMEDEVIFEVVEHALQQNYPKENYDVVVIADKFQPDTIERLSRYPIILYNENFAISTKTRALNYALRALPENQYDIAVILDADNLMEKDFLAKLNDAFSYPFQAIQ
ncbi:MAG TPA: glycosyltransferase, partial [Bacteroidales bacterium]|nr:glycosyltransferase [Bacteroidales bacterium]